MFVAVWNGHEIARSRRTISVENTLYFPPDTVRVEALIPNSQTSVCEWKGGQASYFDVSTPAGVNSGAAWSYAQTSPVAAPIQGWFAFWRGVEVKWVGDGPGTPEILEHAVPNVAKALGATRVKWRPELPFLDPNTPFSGYLIPDLGILVDVLADPGPESRPAIIDAARRRAKKVAQFNRQARNEQHPALQYIAVWGSAPPSSRAVTLLRDRQHVLDLGDEAESVS